MRVAGPRQRTEWLSEQRAVLTATRGFIMTTVTVPVLVIQLDAKILDLAISKHCGPNAKKQVREGAIRFRVSATLTHVWGWIGKRRRSCMNPPELEYTLSDRVESLMLVLSDSFCG